MNCSDLALILDDGDIRTLGGTARSDIDAHVAACPGCLQHWMVHARLVARRLPTLPAGMVEECSALADASPNAPNARRHWTRVAAAAGVVALAAAAATLALRPADRRDDAVLSRIAPPTEIASPPVGAAVETRAMEPAASAAAAPATRAPSASTAVSPPTGADAGFSIRLLSAPTDALDADARQAFEVFRAAVIDELRRTPGVTLIVTEDSSAASANADYEITVGGARQNGRMSGTLRVRRTGPDAVVLPVAGVFSLECGTDCFQEATSVATKMIQLLLRLMAPAQPAERAALVATLQDMTLTPAERLAALRILDPRSSNMQNALRRPVPGASLNEAGIVSGAIDLAFVATDATHRAEVWRSMRGVGHAQLVEPLIRAAQLDPSPAVRTEAVTTLAADFSGDQRANAALELIANTEPEQGLREIAGRALQSAHRQRDPD